MFYELDTEENNEVRKAFIERILENIQNKPED